MPKSNKLLTLDDLYSYFSNRKRSFNFDAEKEHQHIVVQSSGLLKFEDNADTEGLLSVTLQACHTERNLNGSSISEEVMNNALNSFKNRPILGYIHEVDGQYEFYGHNMHLDDDDNLIYDEIPVGIIPESCNAHLEYDEEKEKDYCVVNGYIFEEYTKASEILQREKECNVSVELAIRKMSYDAKEKVLVIEDFFFQGVTILGVDNNGEKVMPGMAKSNIKISDFSEEKNSIFSQKEINSKLVDALERLNNTLESFNINTDRKEEIVVVEEKFEEEVTKVVEDVTEEVIEEATVEETVTVTEEVTETVDETPVETVEESTVEEQFSKLSELKNGDLCISFSISHEDIRSALYNLISEFDQEDNAWYYIEAVYDDKFVMRDWCSGQIYGCNYKVEDSNVSLDGERYKLYAEYLTQSELDSLNEMRANYSSIKEKLDRYELDELNSSKDAVFADESYAQYLDTEEFKELMSQKENYTVDELKDKAEIAFAKCVRNAGSFSFVDKKDTTRKTIRSASYEGEKLNNSSYGTIFDDAK